MASEREREGDESVPGGVGDVEDAGETTAADTVSGPADTRPVGEGTRVKVGGARAGGEGD